MKYLLGLFVSTLSIQVFAATQPCENHAKAAAIKVYQATQGPFQGSEGIQYLAALKPGSTNPYIYTVTIADNNEDGETWEIDYKVMIQQIGTSCRVHLVKQTAVRN